MQEKRVDSSSAMCDSIRVSLGPAGSRCRKIDATAYWFPGKRGALATVVRFSVRVVRAIENWCLH
jgi:hypothetical protein